MLDMESMPKLRIQTPTHRNQHEWVKQIKEAVSKHKNHKTIALDSMDSVSYMIIDDPIKKQGRI